VYNLYQSGYYRYLINVGLGGLGEDACSHLHLRCAGLPKFRENYLTKFSSLTAKYRNHRRTLTLSLSLSLPHSHTLTNTHTLSLTNTKTHTHTLSLSLSYTHTQTHTLCLSHAHILSLLSLTHSFHFRKY